MDLRDRALHQAECANASEQRIQGMYDAAKLKFDSALLGSVFAFWLLGIFGSLCSPAICLVLGSAVAAYIVHGSRLRPCPNFLGHPMPLITELQALRDAASRARNRGDAASSSVQGPFAREGAPSGRGFSDTAVGSAAESNEEGLVQPRAGRQDCTPSKDQGGGLATQDASKGGGQV